MINTRIILENNEGVHSMLSLVELQQGAFVCNWDPRANPQVFSQVVDNVFAGQQAIENAARLSVARGWKKIYEGPPNFDFPELKKPYGN